MLLSGVRATSSCFLLRVVLISDVEPGRLQPVTLLSLVFVVLSGFWIYLLFYCLVFTRGGFLLVEDQLDELHP